MIPESLFIMWENTSAVYVVSCIISVTSVLLAYYYTRNLSSEMSSATINAKTSSKSLTAASGDKSTEDVLTDEMEGQRPGELGDGNSRLSGNRSPSDYLLSEPIPPQFKKAKEKVMVRKLEAKLTEEQKVQERTAQRQQLAEIFKLVEQQREKYGIKTLDDIEEQMKLYTM